MANQLLPKFHFSVQWGGTRIGFTEVTGLDVETEVIEYRDGASPYYNVQKLPGRTKYSDITLKRGICLGDNELFEWWRENFLFNSLQRRDLTISLLNENHEPAVIWRVRGAFVKKIVGPELNAISNEIAIEELVLAHEGLDIQNG